MGGLWEMVLAEAQTKATGECRAVSGLLSRCCDVVQFGAVLLQLAGDVCVLNERITIS